MAATADALSLGVPQPLPAVSIVIASTADGAALERCCAACLPQARAAGAEVIVVTRGALRPTPPTAALCARTQWVTAPADARLPDLLGLGLARATGDVIAITDTHCVPAPGWLAAVCRAHQTDDQRVVGGGVEPAPDLDWVGWAAFLLEYGQFMAPLDGGPAGAIAGDNLSFRRAALTGTGELAQRGFWKTFAVRDMAANGYALVADPAVVVVQHKSFAALPFLVRRFHHGRCFAGMRAATFSAPRRVAYALLTPMLPAVLLTRSLRCLLPKRRHRIRLMWSLPLMVLGILLWSAGELCGYLAGTGASCRHVV